MRRVEAVRRVLLPLAAPYLGVACLALFALASSHTVPAGLGFLADTAVVRAMSSVQSPAATTQRSGMPSAQSIPARPIGVPSGVQTSALWLVALEALGVALLLLWRTLPTVATAAPRQLLIAVALARGH